MFLIVQHKSQTLVFDMDTVLPFPVPFSDYIKEAVRNDFQDKRYLYIYIFYKSDIMTLFIL